VSAVGPLEQVRPFEDDDVEILELVGMRPVGRRRLLGEIHRHSGASCAPQRHHEAGEELVEAKGVLIEVLGRPARVEAHRGQVQPPVKVDHFRPQAASDQCRYEPAGDIALATAVDAAEADEQRHPRGMALAPVGDLLDDSGQPVQFSLLESRGDGGPTQERDGSVRRP
jgi:hypothetical protein